MSNHTEFDTLMTQIREMWGHQDTLFQIIGETNQWDHKHGADWTFADVPYHLTYCNDDLVSHPLKLGRDLPQEERLYFPLGPALNEWNAQKFAERPSGQTAVRRISERSTR